MYQLFLRITNNVILDLAYCNWEQLCQVKTACKMSNVKTETPVARLEHWISSIPKYERQPCKYKVCAILVEAPETINLPHLHALNLPSSFSEQPNNRSRFNGKI